MNYKIFEDRVNYKGLESLSEVLESCMERFSEYQAITDKYNNVFMTYGDLKDTMNLLATGLQALGVKKGDKVGLFAENNGMWMATSMAILKCGAIDVIRGSNAPIEELEYITNHADCKGLILRDEKLYNAMKPFLAEAALDFVVVTFVKGELDKTNVKAKVYTCDELLKLGEENTFEPVKMSRYDDSTILYTSGTTGNPKGVLLSHENSIYQLDVIHRGFL